MNSLSTVFRSTIRCFLAGVLAVLPLVITVAVVIWVAGLVSTMFGPETFMGSLLQKLGGQVGAQVGSSSTFAYLVGWVVVLAAIFMLGVLVEMGAKKFIRGLIDALAARVPLLRGVYGTARQLVGMMEKSETSDLKRMSVVFCIFGKDTGAAFLALLPTPERFTIDGTDYHAVLVPSAPVPVGGSLIFVPADSVHRSELSVDAFMSIYVSMGVTGPQFLSLSK